MKQYSFYNMDLQLDGVTVEGFSTSNSIIEAGRFAAQHARVMGAKGEMVIATTADRSGYMTFNLLQTSNSNTGLRRLAEFTQETTLGDGEQFKGIGAAHLKDLMGQDRVNGADGFVPKQPVYSRGVGIADVKWVVEFAQLYFSEGLQEDSPGSISSDSAANYNFV